MAAPVRRPATVAEILHTPLRDRVGQYPYLTGVPVLAIALGAGLTAVSRMDFAARGMNGQLAWAVGTGMPMRPAMSEPAGPRTAVVGGVRVQLAGKAEAGGLSDLHFAITDAATGRPIDDLQPYLAAAGHVVVMRADGATFAHEHAEVADEDGRPVFALPGQTFGPELDVRAEFPTAGTYQIWAHFRLTGGSVITAPFTVQAT